MYSQLLPAGKGKFCFLQWRAIEIINYTPEWAPCPGVVFQKVNNNFTMGKIKKSLILDQT